MSYKILVEDDRGRSHVVEDQILYMHAVSENIRMKIQIAISNAAYWLPTTERES